MHLPRGVTQMNPVRVELSRRGSRVLPGVEAQRSARVIAHNGRRRSRSVRLPARRPVGTRSHENGKDATHAHARSGGHSNQRAARP